MCLGGGMGGWCVMGEIRWKLKVMFLNNDTLNTIEAQYGSKTEDIIHQFELFLGCQLFTKLPRPISDCHSVNSPPSSSSRTSNPMVLKSAFLYLLNLLLTFPKLIVLFFIPNQHPYFSLLWKFFIHEYLYSEHTL